MSCLPIPTARPPRMVAIACGGTRRHVGDERGRQRQLGRRRRRRQEGIAGAATGRDQQRRRVGQVLAQRRIAW